jgi:accessory gene regulator protein AgrB
MIFPNNYFLKESDKVVTIAEVADRIGEHIGTQAGLQTEIKKICYGVECLLVILLSIAIILMLGWLCGVFMETALITFSALLMKHIIGGPHLSGFLRCTGFSALILIGAAWLLNIYGSPSPWWFITLAVLGSGIVLLYGPMFNSEYKFNKRQVRFRKILSAFILVLLAGLNIWRYDLWLAALMLGVLLTVMLRTPIGIWTFQWLEQISKGKEAQSA